MTVCRTSRRLHSATALPLLGQVVLLTWFSGPCVAYAWPTFRAGSDRTGVTNERLQLPLTLAWQYRPVHPPQPAYRDGLAPSKDRVESLTYDYVFEPVLAAGRLFFGSSGEDTVCCLDCATGELLWTFYTEGPVRFAPCVSGSRLHFGSDDGHVYCLNVHDGALIWKLRAAPDDRRCVGNGRLISAWPVRTSVSVAEDTVYFGAGLLPTTGTYLGAANAVTGTLLWRRAIPYSSHGEILVEGDRLVVATGRTAPAEFRRSDGRPLAEEPSPRRTLGGSFVGKLNDMLVWGPDESGVMFLRVSPEPIAELRAQERGTVIQGHITGLQARSMVARDRLYLVRPEQILAIDWSVFRHAAQKNPQLKWRRWEKTTDPRYGSHLFGLGRAGLLNSEDVLLFNELEKTKLWSIPNAHELATAILEGDQLLLGGKDIVVILDAATGALLHKFAPAHAEHDWGHVGVAGDLLLGSEQKTPADEYSSGTRREGHRFLTRARDLYSRPTVSRSLFAFDYKTRLRVWIYDRSSAILNSTITVGHDRVYFLESRAPEVLADETCAVPTASANGLYFRRDSCYMLDLPSRQTVDLTAVTRPGCWMSIIPAGGLILIPEASSACTCGFALQTSVVLAPVP